MKIVFRSIAKALGGFLLALTLSMGVPPVPCLASSDTSMVKLHDHVPAGAIANARLLGPLPATTEISMAFFLPLRNQQELEELLKRIHDPADTLYGHYLTPQEFADRFAPTQDDHDVVAAHARSLGFKITRTHPNRTLLDISGPVAAVETAFNLRLNHHQALDGRKFYAPDKGPEFPPFIASRIAGVIGLDNAAVWHAHRLFVPAEEAAQTSPFQIGTGSGGGLTPGDIRTAYNLNGVAANGAGQTLGLFELDGYNAADVATYVNHYGLPSVPIQNVLIDGFSGTAGTNADEVTLDIELQIALAPGASKIIVYQGPNSDMGVVHTYNRIATDNLARQISTSWGLSEGQMSAAVISSENAAFQQMAAQGQSIYAASGDSGAYDNGFSLGVDDPASQPYMVGVGGTQLFVNPDETYNHETTWNVNNQVIGGAGGGGVSSLWSIPAWQQGVTSAASAIMRNVPDVSLNADPYTGYSVYYNGSWWIYGGTSCAAPLWAAFTALVNQQRLANGMTTLGFANPAIYQIATGAGYGTGFHDIADGSTNLYYSAVTGYDNATGWGSFNGANLMAGLATPPALLPPTGLTATAGRGSVTLRWTASPGATSYKVYRGIASGQEGSTPIKTGITTTTYTDRVTNGVTYYYEVSATNSAGTSAPSSEVSATPVAPPTAPTKLTYAVNAPTPTTVAVTLNWVSTGSNVTAFTIQRATDTGFTTGLVTFKLTGAPPLNTYTDTATAVRTTYYYRVQAKNQAGTSAWSSVVTVIAIPSPSNLTAGVVTRNGVTLTWVNGTTAGTLGVAIQRATNAVFTTGLTTTYLTPGTVTSRTITGLAHSTTYWFRVAARTATGLSAWSNVVSATTLP